MQINGDKATMIIVKTALIRALNSLDNEVAEVKQFTRHTPEQISAKLSILKKSRDEMTELHTYIAARSFD